MEYLKEQLGWNMSTVARRFCQIRSDENGNPASFEKYQPTVCNIIKNPKAAKLNNLKDVVEAMGGEVFIFFPDNADKLKKETKQDETIQQ